MLPVVAWRSENLKGACRAAPGASFNEYFTDQEWIALMIFLRRREVDPSKPPAVSQFMTTIAQA
jgi:hypothetical protein